MFTGPKIVTDGLVLALDGGNYKSLKSGSSDWYDLTNTYISSSIMNGATITSTQFGNALEYDGTDDFVITPITASDWASVPFTIQSTFQWQNANANQGFFSMNGTGGLTSSVQTVPRTGKLYFYWINSTGNGGHSVQSSLIQTGVPINITITFTGIGGTDRTVLYNNTKVYLNGEEYSHSNDGGAGTGTNGRLCVGSEQYKFRGNMYDFKYYDRLLTAEEVLQNYNATKRRFNL
jgi:hypothetical protein